MACLFSSSIDCNFIVISSVRIYKLGAEPIILPFTSCCSHLSNFGTMQFKVLCDCGVHIIKKTV